MSHLAGTTWSHVRAIAPLAAASQWFADARPGVTVTWSTHGARQFGEGPLEPLADAFDLICFDHPHTGHAAAHRLFTPLDQCLSRAELEALSAASLGESFGSYADGGVQWGVPIDAACTMSASSPVKLASVDLEVPADFDELIRSARAHPGRIVQPFSRMTTTAVFFSIATSLSDAGPRRLDAHTFGDALDALCRLHEATHAGHGIALGSMEALRLLMDPAHEAAHAPFVYPYACFARTDLLEGALIYGDHPSLPAASACRGVLGGAGIAISAHARNPALASDLLRWLVSARCQSTFMQVCLGQPADRRAWSTGPIDDATRGFYSTGLARLDAAWLRPTDVAFQSTQSRLADLLHRCLDGQRDANDTLRDVTDLLLPYATIETRGHPRKDRT